MAVERLTDYTRRIWTALDADAPEGHDFQVNDVIYYMDSSQCGIVTYVYPEGSIDVEFLPDIGGETWPATNEAFSAKNRTGSSITLAYARHFGQGPNRLTGSYTSTIANNGQVGPLTVGLQPGNAVVFHANHVLSKVLLNDAEVEHEILNYASSADVIIIIPDDLLGQSVLFTFL